MPADSSQTDSHAVSDWKMRKSLKMNPSTCLHCVYPYKDMESCNDDVPAFPPLFTHDRVQDECYTCIDINDNCLSHLSPSIIPPHLRKSRSFPTFGGIADLPK